MRTLAPKSAYGPNDHIRHIATTIFQHTYESGISVVHAGNDRQPN